ncbi:hypothetical protein ABEB36_015393 [Hypothenemus hampei]|uniref:G-protein coupled receptors family 1 profile domain-containing protein n=1 Tax=Hypothenemus hampei TaxID=57062 RepID=A0ABD1E019_HYPHA
MVAASWNTSYVFGYDDQWGGRYFFTYFSEFSPPNDRHYLLEIVLLVITFIFSIMANISIIICVTRNPEMKTVTNCFVLNLAISDVLFAFTIPVVAYTRFTRSWVFGKITCKLVPYLQFVSAMVLLWTLTFISIDRHHCIVVPPYRSNMSRLQAVGTSLLIWLIFSGLTIPVALWFKEITLEEDLMICTLVFPKSRYLIYSTMFIIIVALLACLLPMVLLVYYYHQIFRKILSTKNAWSTSCVEIKSCRTQTRRQSELSFTDILVPWSRRFSAQLSIPNSSRQGSLSTQEEIRLNKHLRAVRVLFLNVLVVLVMWLPITLMMVLIHIDGRRSNEDKGYFLRSHHFVAALSVAFINTVINPLLYGLLSDNFRNGLMKIWCIRHERVQLGDLTTPSSGRTAKMKRPSASFSERSEKFGLGLI